MCMLSPHTHTRAQHNAPTTPSGPHDTLAQHLLQSKPQPATLPSQHRRHSAFFFSSSPTLRRSYPRLQLYAYYVYFHVVNLSNFGPPHSPSRLLFSIPLVSALSHLSPRGNVDAERIASSMSSARSRAVALVLRRWLPLFLTFLMGAYVGVFISPLLLRNHMSQEST